MLDKINKSSINEFTEMFGNIFENAAWIAEKLYMQRPFNNFQDISQKIINIFELTNNESKIKILNSHPDLADKIKIGLLTKESNNEQNDAGLNQCSEEEFKEFKNLNINYKSKFGFPFILAVKGKNKIEILNSFRKRILSTKEEEYIEAIKQVKLIASLRLQELKYNEKLI